MRTTLLPQIHQAGSECGIAVADSSGDQRRVNIILERHQILSGSDTAAARFLERYGEGIYLIIYQIDDSLAADDHLKGLGIRYTSSRETENYTNLGFNSIWLHPSAMKGAFTQLSQILVSDNPWPPAGADWHK